MSSFDQPSETIASSWSLLQGEWAECREHWDDAVALRFEREFWSEWEKLLPSLIPVLRQLEDALSDAMQVAQETGD